MSILSSVAVAQVLCQSGIVSPPSLTDFVLRSPLQNTVIGSEFPESYRMARSQKDNTNIPPQDPIVCHCDSRESAGGASTPPRLRYCACLSGANRSGHRDGRNGIGATSCLGELSS